MTTEQSKPERKRSSMKTLSAIVGIIFWCVGAYQMLNANLTLPQGAIQQAVTSVWTLTAVVALGFGSVLAFRD